MVTKVRFTKKRLKDRSTSQRNSGRRLANASNGVNHGKKFWTIRRNLSQDGKDLLLYYQRFYFQYLTNSVLKCLNRPSNFFSKLNDLQKNF